VTGGERLRDELSARAAGRAEDDDLHSGVLTLQCHPRAGMPSIER